jgi:molybdopterin-containing oxidoreductase family membrane subunit
MLFWDASVLSGYLILNVLCGWVALTAESKNVAPPKWIKPFIYISIPFAISIHTVTAFLYCGLPGRHFWLTAILAPRFLASAFAAGPALLILLAIFVRKVSNFDAGDKAIQKLTTIITYAAIINLFFVGLEVFVAFYSNIPGHMHTFQYLFAGLEGHNNLVSMMWVSTILGIVAVILLLMPGQKKKEGVLIFICLAIFISLWIDKGIGLILGGFVPSPMEHVTEYSPTGLEILIVLGIYAIGLLILTVLYKTALAIKVRNEHK